MTRATPFILLATLLCTTTVAQDADDALLRDAARRSVAVAAVLDMLHQTPAERLQAVFTLLDLGELDVAAVLLKPVLDARLNDQAKAELVNEFGTARFLSLARRDGPVAEGQPAPLAGAREFAESCIAAASKMARDPKRIARLVSDLNDPSAEIRNAARVDLAVTGTAGAQACFEALGKTEDEAYRANLLHALADLRPEMDPLLAAVLADGKGRVIRDAAELAGHVGMLDAAPFLAAIAVSEPDAASRSAAQTALVRLGLSQADLGDARTLLLGEMRRLEAGVPTDLIAEDANFWWSYSPAEGKFDSKEVTTDALQLLTVARLAKVLGALPEAIPQDQQTALLYAYQAARALKQPLPPEFQKLSSAFSVADLNAVLAEALKHGQVAAALASAELLGDRRDTAALSSFDTRPSPLAQALKYPDRKLQFVALEAVMKISPQRSFPGSSAVAPILWRFAAGGGPPQAVVACSVVSRASDWAGQLRALGYDATPATTGREALETAVLAPRLALFLVDSDIGRPLLREVLYQLRGNTATAGVPVAILSSEPNYARAQQLAGNDALLLAEVRPHDQAEFKAIIERLVELDGALGTNDQRTNEAAQALTWIAKLLETGHPYDELLREADFASETLYEQKLFEPSLSLLTALGTAGSQRTLIDFASEPTAAIAARQKAAQAFAASVERHGKLLTPTEVARQFDRYNASETADRDTQKVLGYLLDVLETKPPQPFLP